MIRFASTGNESTGKSAVLNAVFRTRFRVDARARSTAFPARETVRHGNSEIEVIDSPPLTMRVGKLEADAYLLVCDKDLTQPEYEEALRICRAGRALGVVLNKIDTYSTSHRVELLQHIQARLHGYVPGVRIVQCAADPVRVVYQQCPDGTTIETFVPMEPDIRELELLVHEMILEAENSFRVRTRELANRTSSRVSTFLRERLR